MHISLAVCGTNHTFLSMILCVRITLIDNALPLLTVYNHPNLILSLLCLSVLLWEDFTTSLWTISYATAFRENIVW